MPGYLDFNISSISNEFERKALFEYMLGNSFVIVHSLGDARTSIVTSYEKTSLINSASIGIKVDSPSKTSEIDLELFFVPLATFCPKQTWQGVQHAPEYPLDTLYKIFNSNKSTAFTSFVAPSPEEVTRLRDELENRASSISVRRSFSTALAETRQNTSDSADLHYNSFEKRVLGLAIDNITDIMLSRYASYKVAFFIEATDSSDEIIRYLQSNSIILGKKKIRARSIVDLIKHASGSQAIPLSYQNAAQAISLSYKIARTSKIETRPQSCSGDIRIGRYLDSAINETAESVSISSKSLNLGTLITGMPGTGKTRSAQGIISQASEITSKPIIISPTGEWRAFAEKNSIDYINLQDPTIRINFFKCETTNRRKFYESLAMLMATGCRAGPYRNSIEKCLLSAFSKVYLNSSNPDPQDVYSEIEEAIIEQHGRRTGAGVKYTKHGENTKSSLESLRQVLMMCQFAYSGGISFSELTKSGAVFDLSGISNNSKPIIYSLILNQVYNLCDEFDVYGDQETRLIICLEEAQLVFGLDDDSGATQDLGERIQNFRKTGVALMLITHNINDISPNIRRLCQNKLYFRQSADVAKYAANDLIFDESQSDNIISILKTMGQRVCAVNSILTYNGAKNASNSVFSKVDEYLLPRDAKAQVNFQVQHDPTEITLSQASQESMPIRYEIYYLGEKMCHGELKSQRTAIPNLLKGKSYKIILLSDKKRNNREFIITGGASNELPQAEGQD